MLGVEVVAVVVVVVDGGVFIGERGGCVQREGDVVISYTRLAWLLQF